MLEIRRASNDRIRDLWVERIRNPQSEARLVRMREDEWDAVVAKPTAVVSVADEDPALSGIAVASLEGQVLGVAW